MKRYNGSYSLGDEDTQQELEKLTPGCFVFVYEKYEGDKLLSVEPITMHKFDYALSTMIDKENCLSLQMRYFNPEEREAGAQFMTPDSRWALQECIRN